MTDLLSILGLTVGSITATAAIAATITIHRWRREVDAALDRMHQLGDDLDVLATEIDRLGQTIDREDT